MRTGETVVPAFLIGSDQSGNLLSVATNAGWKMSVVVVFGGTGFLGRRFVHRLAAEGTPVRVAVRHPNGGRSALRSADLDQITFFRADVRDQASVAAAKAESVSRHRQRALCKTAAELAGCGGGVGSQLYFPRITILSSTILSSWSCRRKILRTS